MFEKILRYATSPLEKGGKGDLKKNHHNSNFHKTTKFAFIFFLLSLFSLATQAQENILTLEEAIQTGLENNFSVKIARNDQEVANNNLSPGNAGMLPNLDVLAIRNFDVQDSELDFASGDGQTVENARSNATTLSSVVSWTIFDGTRMFATYNKLKEIQQASNLDAQVTLENLVADIASAYYTVILEQELLTVIQSALELSDIRKQLAKTQYEVGRTSKLEYLAAQADYNADTSAFISQRQQMYNAKVDLNTLLARPSDAEFSVPDQIDANLELRLAGLKEKMLSANPQLLRARQEENIAYLTNRELRADRLPTISVDGGYNYATSEAEAGFVLARQSDGFAYGVTARWNLFNGFNKNRLIQNAQIAMETQQYATQDLRLQLESGLEKTFINYTNSIQLIELETENEAIALERAEIALERYRLGNTNSLELREAQRIAVAASGRLLDAVYSTKIAEIELMRLSGKLASSSY
ncbi:TolC family protein [Tunicatimonas pelagia]|uniref:TolC family protein n=1 Tax=Tunicatimonas pelagia TaxID=931531 RepID=UPI0026651B2E|nr:TolC family protein [Tunicatimonas pelagia]WKN45103.1 TolC family protein [Tunicatimonas pelagia]